MPIEQALHGNPDGTGPRLLARSPGLADRQLAEVERLCLDFGPLPPGTRCPLALFAQPVSGGRVAVVQVTEPGLFRVLLLPKRLYADLGGDLFWVSDSLPPAWDVRGDLPALEWTAGPPPARTVARVREVLNVVADRTQTLLGGVQALIDGGRLVFERPAPDADIVRDLWALLPSATRCELWPATFVCANAGRFQLVVVPSASGPEFEHYIREPAAGDYPEGGYEYTLQKAAEEGDQAELDALFARKGRGQMLRLAVILLAAFVVVGLLTARSPVKPQEPPKQEKKEDRRE